MDRDNMAATFHNKDNKVGVGARGLPCGVLCENWYSYDCYVWSMTVKMTFKINKKPQTSIVYRVSTCTCKAY